VSRGWAGSAATSNLALLRRRTIHRPTTTASAERPDGAEVHIPPLLSRRSPRRGTPPLLNSGRPSLRGDGSAHGEKSPIRAFEFGREVVAQTKDHRTARDPRSRGWICRKSAVLECRSSGDRFSNNPIRSGTRTSLRFGHQPSGGATYRLRNGRPRALRRSLQRLVVSFGDHAGGKPLIELRVQVGEVPGAEQ
jgi:hypothetical protein